MGISLYDITVAGFIQTVTAMEGVLQRGLAHCRDAGIDTDVVVAARLFPDMLPFRFQVDSIVRHSAGAIESVKAGLFSRPPETPAFDYAGLQRHLAQANARLKTYTADELNSLEGKDMIFQPGEREIPFTTDSFLLSFSVPNFHFHATTAYDILRSRGVPLGKRDYLGRLRVKT